MCAVKTDTASRMDPEYAGDDGRHRHSVVSTSVQGVGYATLPRQLRVENDAEVSSPVDRSSPVFLVNAFAVTPAGY